MPASRLFGQITVGGDHSDNPSNYDWKSYINYPDLDLTLTYLRVDVIVPNGPQFLQVTGLAQVVNGRPLMGPTDLCFTPCPPAC